MSGRNSPYLMELLVGFLTKNSIERRSNPYSQSLFCSIKPFFIILARLRRHFMDVFHYVADQLKDESLFDSPPLKSFNISGSVYNDFDRTNFDLLDTHSQKLFCYSQTTNFDDNQDSDDDAILLEAVDHTIMQEDRSADVYKQHWDTPLFDDYGCVNEIEYIAKVFELSTNHDVWDDLTFTKDCVDMFKRRERTNWEGFTMRG